MQWLCAFKVCQWSLHYTLNYFNCITRCQTETCCAELYNYTPVPLVFIAVIVYFTPTNGIYIFKHSAVAADDDDIDAVAVDDDSNNNNITITQKNKTNNNNNNNKNNDNNDTINTTKILLWLW